MSTITRNKDATVTIEAYGAEDVLRVLDLASEIAHRQEMPSPLCCTATAGLLLTAAEILLRGGVAQSIGPVNEAMIRGQAVAAADGVLARGKKKLRMPH